MVTSPIRLHRERMRIIDLYPETDSTAFSYAIVKRDSRLIIELDAAPIPIPRIFGRSPRSIRASGGGCACVSGRAACLVQDVRGRWNCGACCGQCTNGTPDAPTAIHHVGPEAGEVYARGSASYRALRANIVSYPGSPIRTAACFGASAGQVRLGERALLKGWSGTWLRSTRRRRQSKH